MTDNETALPLPRFCAVCQKLIFHPEHSCFVTSGEASAILATEAGGFQSEVRFRAFVAMSQAVAGAARYSDAMRRLDIALTGLPPSLDKENTPGHSDRRCSGKG